MIEQDDAGRAFIMALKGELSYLRASITRIEEMLDGSAVTREHFEKLMGPQAMRQTRAKLDRDPEVRRFILDQVANQPGTMEEIVERARAKFGKKRVPSPSTIHTYLRKLRRSGRSAKVIGK